eukprot:TRINITY_DN5474_c1_g1_i1.p2 TRINITY_DN5474_c1_g1~~TRINITY_DN5474_c1_g1_i1.p2  ORF type:complete len:289 (-),score=72.43 TRINITY_DN5474_c1_g1_i1:124-990(-)
MGLNAASAFSTALPSSSASTPSSALHAADVYHVDVLGAEDDAAPIPAADPWVSLTGPGGGGGGPRHLPAGLCPGPPPHRLCRLGVGVPHCRRGGLDPRLGGGGHDPLFPVLTGAGPGDGVRERLAALGGWNGTGEGAKGGWLARWLSPEAAAANVELASKYADALDRMCAANVGRYVWADARRRDVGAALAAAPRGGVGGRVLMFGGRAAAGAGAYAAVVEGLGVWSPGSASLIGVEGAGAAVVEEAPHEVVEAVRLFFMGLGCVWRGGGGGGVGRFFGVRAAGAGVP